MRILVGACFGLGNTVLKIPMIRALRMFGQVDVLIGTGPDDFGSEDVIRSLFTCDDAPRDTSWFYKDFVPLDVRYDIAIMCIPFDGRWRNGVHYRANHVIDGRTRPDPNTTGLVSWKKHEVEYQLDNLWELFPSDFDYCGTATLAFQEEIQKRSRDTSFLQPAPSQHIFLGLGYKRDKDGFWAQKHWGNEKYAKLVDLIHERTGRKVLMTGSPQDHAETIRPILHVVKDRKRVVVEHSTQKLQVCMRLAAGAAAYVGNDTGMMHVAAAHGVPTVGIFRMEHLVTKNHPWGTKHWKALEDLDGSLSPEDVFRALEDILCTSSSQAERDSSEATSSGS